MEAARAIQITLVTAGLLLSAESAGGFGNPMRADGVDSGGATALQSCPPVEDEIVDLDLLAEGLKNSNAVGFLEKLRLKKSIDELLARFSAYHYGSRSHSLVELQEQYNVLLMRIAAHLQHKDRSLHGQLCNAWFEIWHDLEDPDRFSEKFS